MKNKIAVRRKDDKYNYINDSGKLLLENDVELCLNFRNGYGVIGNNHKYNYVNEKGEIIFPIWFDNVSNYDNHFFKVIVNNKMKFYDINMKEYFSDVNIDYAYNCINNIYLVKINNKMNFFDINNGFLLDDNIEIYNTVNSIYIINGNAYYVNNYQLCLYTQINIHKYQTIKPTNYNIITNKKIITFDKFNLKEIKNNIRCSLIINNITDKLYLTEKYLKINKILN